MRRSSLRKVSPKRQAELKLYSALRKSYLKANPKCQACCRAKSTDVHHKAGRNHALLNLTLSWMAVCRACHDMIHRHPGEARSKGWLT